MDGREPVAVSVARRRLLLAMGFGAANVAVLRKLPLRRRGRAGGEGAAAEAGREPAADGDAAPESDELPEAPVVDEAAAVPVGEQEVFDLVISGGRVIDPNSGFDAVASLGIKGSTVAAFASISAAPLLSPTTIDATGLVVSPGFIDILSYSPNGYGEWYKLADGVTSNLGMHGLDSRAEPWFAAHPDGSSPIHFGGAYDHAEVRFMHGLGPYQEADPVTAAAILSDARADLSGGFIGLHMQPEHTPATTAVEVLAHAVLAAEHDVPLCVHARYSDNQEPGTNLEAIDELINAARETGAHVHVEHINSTGGTGVMAEALDRLKNARDDGAQMTACIYPYDFWAAYAQSARFDNWEQKYGIGFSDLQVVGTAERLTAATFDEAHAANALTAAFAIPPDDIKMALQADFVMVGSDSILLPSHASHPRATGCFSRVLGRYVRDLGVIDLTSALSKMTIQPARLLERRCPALRRKGRIAIGSDADITVFDPAAVADRSTVDDPARESEGIRWVIVEGKVMKSPDSLDVTGTSLPGRALRSDIV